MTIRVTIDDSATAHIVRPGGGGVVVPRHAGEMLVAWADRDGEQFRRLSHNFPQTAAAMQRAGWLDEHVVHRKVPKAPHLKRLQIEVLLACNLSCGYCYSTSGPGRKERLSHREVIDVIDQADAMAVQQIDFTGGEYLMTPGWREQVAHARELGMIVTVHTNGTLLTTSAVEALRELSVAYVQVSVDSHLEEVHDAARGHRHALRRTLAGLDRLHDAGVECRISLMVHRDNVDTMADTIEYFSERYPSFLINIDRVIGTTDAAKAVGVSNETFWGVVSPYLGERVLPSKACGTDVSAETFEPDCGVFYSYLYLTAEGEIAVCPTMTSREEARFAGPSIRDTSLWDAWYTNEMMTGLRHTNCENVTDCPAGSSCGGGCRSNAYNDTGRLTGPDYIACNKNKNPGTAFVDFASLYARVR